jgi:hypothetical protein
MSLKEQYEAAVAKLVELGEKTVWADFTVSDLHNLMHRAQADINRLRRNLIEEDAHLDAEIESILRQHGVRAEEKLRLLFVTNEDCRAYADQKVVIMDIRCRAFARNERIV